MMVGRLLQLCFGCICSVNILFLYFLFNTSAREKQKALGSITEVVQTVKQSRFHTESSNDDATEQSDKETLKFKKESAMSKNFSAKGIQTPQLDTIKHSTTEPVKPEYASVVRSTNFCCNLYFLLQLQCKFNSRLELR